MEEERAAGRVTVRPKGRVDRLLQATSALADTLGADSLEPVSRATVEQARRLVHARLVLLLLEDRNTLVVSAVAGNAPATVRSLRERTDGAAWRRALTERTSERVAPVTGRLGAALTEAGIDAAAALLVPLVVRDRAIGVIAALDRVDGPEFTADDEAAPDRLRGERGHGRRPDAVARRSATPREHRGGRARAGPLGARASRRDPPRARRAARDAGVVAPPGPPGPAGCRGARRDRPDRGPDREPALAHHRAAPGRARRARAGRGDREPGREPRRQRARRQPRPRPRARGRRVPEAPSTASSSRPSTG